MTKNSLNNYAKKLNAQRARTLRHWVREVNDGPAFPPNITKIELIFHFDDGATANMKLEPAVTKRARIAPR